MNITEISDITKNIDANKIIKIVLSNKREKIYNYNKVVIKPIVTKDGGLIFQCESFTDKQAFHTNISSDELSAYILDQLRSNFKQLDGFLADKTISAKLSKKNKILYSEKKVSSDITATSHNKEKNYIIPVGTYVPALFELGVITKDGKIINSKYDKFKQINRFVEIIDDSLKNENKECINIIDFGCGKSYLTFVIYHYLTEIKKVKANIIGLDLKIEVIEKCNETAKKYGYDGLQFYCGDIKDYRSDFVPDVVISLHACDTATDYAIYNAISWGAKYIFSVPCCQHEVNSTITSDVVALTDYGIIKERLSALITDTVRGKLLEYSGYSVDVMEFIDIAHSPKNLLIRARKANLPKSKKDKALDEIYELKKQYEFKHTLYDLIIKQS